MRMISVLYALLMVPLYAQVSPVASSESKDVVPAFDSSGAITLPVADLKLDIVYPNGKKERCDLTAGYDPPTGHYFWRYAPLTFPEFTGSYIKAIKSHYATVYVDAAGLYVFEFPNGFWLMVLSLIHI